MNHAVRRSVTRDRTRRPAPNTPHRPTRGDPGRAGHRRGRHSSSAGPSRRRRHHRPDTSGRRFGAAARISDGTSNAASVSAAAVSAIATGRESQTGRSPAIRIRIRAPPRGVVAGGRGRDRPARTREIPQVGHSFLERLAVVVRQPEVLAGLDEDAGLQERREQCLGIGGGVGAGVEVVGAGIGAFIGAIDVFTGFVDPFTGPVGGRFADDLVVGRSARDAVGDRAPDRRRTGAARRDSARTAASRGRRTREGRRASSHRAGRADRAGRTRHPRPRRRRRSRG